LSFPFFSKTRIKNQSINHVKSKSWGIILKNDLPVKDVVSGFMQEDKAYAVLINYLTIKNGKAFILEYYSEKGRLF